MPIKTPEYILTFDVGSKTSAYAYGTDGNLVKYGKYAADEKLYKEYDDHGMRLLNFSKWVSKVIRHLPCSPSLVLIESPYYNRNPTTFAVLSKFVGCVEREARRVLGDSCDIKFISASAVKSILDVPKGRTHKERKSNMVKRINRLLGLDLSYSSSKKKSDDDLADAIAILLAHFKKEENDNSD